MVGSEETFLCLQSTSPVGLWVSGRVLGGPAKGPPARDQVWALQGGCASRTKHLEVLRETQPRDCCILSHRGLLCALQGVRHGCFAPASFECGCSLLCHTGSRIKLQASLLAKFANSRAQEVTKAHSIELKQAAMTWIEELQAFCWGQKTWDAACKNCPQKTASSWKPWMRRHRPPKRDNENKTE